MKNDKLKQELNKTVGIALNGASIAGIMKKLHQTSKAVNTSIVLIILSILSGQVICRGYTDSLGTGEVNNIPEKYLQRIKLIEFRGADLRDVVSSIAMQHQLNVFVKPEVDVNVTTRLVDVRILDVFRHIAKRYNLQLQFEDGILTVLPPVSPQPDCIIRWNDNRLSIDVQNEPLQLVLHRLSDSTGYTIMADQSITADISGKVTNLPFDEALTLLMRTNGFRLNQNGNAWLVERMFLNKQQTGSGLWVQKKGRLLRIQAQKAPIARVLGELSRVADASLSIIGEPDGQLTINMSGATLEECLQTVLLETGFSWRRERNLYLIAKNEAPSMQTSRLFRLNHLKVDGVIERLPNKAVASSDLKVIPEHNALLVNGSPSVIMQIEDILQEIDKPIPQVFFEALVVDYTVSDSYEFSVQAGLEYNDSTRARGDGWIPGIDFLWNGSVANTYLGKLDKALKGVSIGKLPDDFYLRVRALESAGKAKIRSRPQISSLNGHSAELKVGETQYYKLISETPLRDPSQVLLQTTERFQTVEINISLKVTPWVSASGEITVEIYPEFNTPGEQLAPGLPPNVQSRSLSSTVRLRDGETIVLGGLIQEIDSESVSRVPLLGRIPLLGKLFSNTRRTKAKSELIIYVTPHLLYTEDWLPEGEMQ